MVRTPAAVARFPGFPVSCRHRLDGKSEGRELGDELPFDPAGRANLCRYGRRARRGARGRGGFCVIREFLHRSWPWYVTGPLVGLVAVSLLLIGNKPFGISSNLRHLCAACLPRRADFFKYDWKRVGLWNLVFMLGTVVGGFIGGVLLSNSHPAAISGAAVSSLARLGIHDFSGLVPREVFNWHVVLSVRGLLLLVGGGFLTGFGTAYGGGCTKVLVGPMVVAGLAAVAGTWVCGHLRP